MTTPLIAAEAARLGVNVSAVAATGTGGRVSLADVRAAAGTAYRPTARTAARPVTAQATAASNPLVAHARSADPGACAEADRHGPAPTLFTGGDLPPVTASGMDPPRLLDVPPEARHALAAATDAEALALHERYSSPGATVSDYRVAGHAGWTDYTRRVSAWLGTVRTPSAVVNIMVSEPE